MQEEMIRCRAGAIKGLNYSNRFLIKFTDRLGAEAVHQFLEDDALQNGESEFEIDKLIENQLMITAALDGFLRRK